MKNNNEVVDFVFVSVREYTGVDLDGQIAIPRDEAQKKLKEVYDGYAAYAEFKV